MLGLNQLVFTLLVLSLSTHTLANPTVTITDGTLSGSWTRTSLNRVVAAFQGIPYAKAPLGELRFEPPMRNEAWDGTLEAIHEVPECPQYGGINQGVRGQEDCLYLNVFCYPDFNSTDDSKPVMVFIHGGALLSGSSASSVFGPNYLLDFDVVLVTINYRLGPLGFLTLPEGSFTGNQGVRDQILALEWVQANIHHFGGDPNRVTIFGESAGSWSVAQLLTSPEANGLFHRAIGQSGTNVGDLNYVFDTLQKASHDGSR
eukprot:maker-scaffold349_size200065-snap-gene-1.20 protein:Tk10537 transcript:maker-scaffold349_size200065-snap-gene-1.20-mRNA-1 annotation:"esterase fe4"